MSRQSFAQIVFSCIVLLAAGENVAFCQFGWGAQPRVVRPSSETKVAAQGLGQLVVVDGQTCTWQRLSVGRYHVNVVISAPVALVQIDETFYNPYDGKEGGTFVLNLPPGASVCRFATYAGPNEVQEGELVAWKVASEMVKSSTHRETASSIFEQSGNNLFCMRVASIPGRDEKRILVDYTVPLEQAGDGRCQFSLPLLSDLEPVCDFRIGGRIVGPVLQESIVCPSHPELKTGVQVTPKVGGSELENESERGLGTSETDAFGGPFIPFELSRQDYKPNRPFTLHFQESREDLVSVQIYRSALPATVGGRGSGATPCDSGEAKTYFRVEIRDTDGIAPSRKPLDLLILADTSGDMLGHDQDVKRSVNRLLGSLREEDRARLVCVDVVARPMHEGWLEANSEVLREVRERFEREFCLGNADLGSCFGEEMKSFGPIEQDRRRLVVYVGSGEDTRGPRCSSVLNAAVIKLVRDSGIPLMSMFVPGAKVARDEATGTSPFFPWSRGRRLLEAVGVISGGVVWDVSDPFDEPKCQRWMDQGMPTPVRISGVQVKGAGGCDLVFPELWVPCEPFTVVGRVPNDFAKEELDIRVTTACYGQPAELHRQVKVSGCPSNLLIGRLWAEQKLKPLMAKWWDSSMVDTWEYKEVVNLSQQWSVQSPLTAFMVPESEEDRAKWDIEQSPQWYWRPIDAVGDEPLPPEWLAEVDANRCLPAKSSARADASERPLTQEGAGKKADAARVRREELLKGLLWQRALFVPPVGTPQRAQPSLSALTGFTIEPAEDYERLFPHYRELSKRIDLTMPFATIQDVASLLREHSGLTVDVDTRALDDVGLDVNAKSRAGAMPMGRGSCSLQSFARHASRCFAITILAEPDRLVVTTPEEAEVRLSHEVYPVADLFLADRITPPGLLADPWLDLELAAEARIRRQLDRPMAFHAQDMSLAEAALLMATQVDIPLVIDDRALDDVGLSRNMRVSVPGDRRPCKDILKAILAGHGLEYVVRNEALVVTTDWEAEKAYTLRLHSVRGVAWERRVPESERRLNEQSTRGEALDDRPFCDGGMGAFGEGIAGSYERIRRAEGHSGGFGGDGGRGCGIDIHQTMLPKQGESISANRMENPKEAFHVDPLFYEIDFDWVQNAIVETIMERTWDEWGGAGRLAPFPDTLDIVVRQASSVHDEIDRLFERLRTMPSVIPDRIALRPARLPWRDAVSKRELETLWEVIASCACESIWEDYGGPAVMVADQCRGALIISQTQDMHQRIRHLLTQLRRSRYAQLWGERPWEAAGLAADRPLVDPWHLGADVVWLQPDRLSQPTALELEALAWRDLPESGQWRWRQVTADGTQVGTIEILRTPERFEVRLPECVVRIEGEQVALVWPDLGLVELGPWAEAIRHVLDGYLPWLPHRTNADLARWYDVRPAESTAGGEVNAVRLVPPGLNVSDGTCLLLTPADSPHLPACMTSHLAGEVSGALRLDKGDSERPAIVWEDDAGTVATRWELLEYSSGPPAIPPLGKGYEDFVYLDRRGETPEIDPELAQALAAMENSDWATAESKLVALAKGRQRHPLVTMLHAWCYGHQSGSEPPDSLVADLQAAMAGGYSPGLSWLTGTHLAWIGASQRYRILTEYPAKLRTVDDLHALAHLAAKIQQYDAALEWIDEAEQRDDKAVTGTRRFEWQQLRIAVLLKQGRPEQAEGVARRWASRKETSPHEIVTLAEHLADAGRRDVAAELLAMVVDHTKLPDSEKAPLCRRLADLRKGIPRWQRLVEAIGLLPVESAVRQEWLDTLVGELQRPLSADVPIQLAKMTDDKPLRDRLRLCHADLLIDPCAAGDALWSLAEDDCLPPERLQSAMSMWNQIGKPDRVISVCERDLRRGKTLDDASLRILHDAYLAAGRPVDARRADTERCRC